MILEKINKEMEIQSYIRIKEDMHILKELLFDSNEMEMFSKPFEFKEIYESVKNKGGSKGISEYLKKSFSTLIMEKSKKNEKDVKSFENKFEHYKEKIRKT